MSNRCLAVIWTVIAFCISACSSNGSNAVDAGELRDIEFARLQALVDGDMQVSDRLHSDDFQLINPSGQTFTKTEYLGGIESGNFEYLIFEPTSEIEVRLFGDAAVLRYQSTIQIRVGEMTTTPTPHMHTDLYELREAQWQAVWSQATEVLP